MLKNTIVRSANIFFVEWDQRDILNSYYYNIVI